MKLNELLQSDHFEEKEEICPGCQNHCQVRVYSFANGRQYVSGNNCERVYSNEGTTARKGINMFDEKYKLLFEKSQITNDHGSADRQKSQIKYRLSSSKT